MPIVHVPIEIPEGVKGTELEAKLLAKLGRKALEQTVLELYKEGEISTGMGAELLGLPRYDFIQFLGQHQVSIFQYTEEELKEEFQAADEVVTELKAEKEKR